MIIRTFLESYKLKGKKIVTFCIGGGSGISGSMKGVKAAAKGAKVVKGKDLTDASYKSVKNWAKKNVKYECSYAIEYVHALELPRHENRNKIMTAVWAGRCLVFASNNFGSIE